VLEYYPGAIDSLYDIYVYTKLARNFTSASIHLKSLAHLQDISSHAVLSKIVPNPDSMVLCKPTVPVPCLCPNPIPDPSAIAKKKHQRYRYRYRYQNEGQVR
jgi:hypothetical protein